MDVCGEVNCATPEAQEWDVADRLLFLRKAFDHLFHLPFNGRVGHSMVGSN
jgi:hypothetical protein